MAAPDRSTLAIAARRLYSKATKRYRLLQGYRPYICPFEEILPHIPKGASVLDIGCGAGLFLGLLADAGGIRKGCGVDISDQAIHVARQMAARNNFSDRLNFLTGTFDSAALSEKFTAVTMIDVLHHVPKTDQREFVLRAAEKVDAGGLLVIKEILDRPGILTVCNTIHDLLLAQQWPLYVSRASLLAWTQEANLELIKESVIFRLWYCHRFMLFQHRRG